LFDALAFEICARYPRDLGRRIQLPDYPALCRKLAGEHGAASFLQEARSLIAVSGFGDRTIVLPIDQFEELLAASSNAIADKARELAPATTIRWIGACAARVRGRCLSTFRAAAVLVR
jgi:hypothetical protein